MLFRGKFWFLSNFYPVEVKMYGVVYPSVENAFQASKCVRKEDRVIFESVSSLESKKLGRKVELRKDWEDVRVNIMNVLLCRKFENKELRDKLLRVEGEIVEDNSWGDEFWGRCNGRGKNVLGNLLMNLRFELS